MCANRSQTSKEIYNLERKQASFYHKMCCFSKKFCCHTLDQFNQNILGKDPDVDSFSFSFFWLWVMWDLSSQRGIKPIPQALKAWALNHWTARKVPKYQFQNWFQYATKNHCFGGITNFWWTTFLDTNLLGHKVLKVFDPILKPLIR